VVANLVWTADLSWAKSRETTLSAAAQVGVVGSAVMTRVWVCRRRGPRPLSRTLEVVRHSVNLGYSTDRGDLTVN
jgi:hypothetical protein